LIFGNGGYYIGEFNEDKMDGKGILYDKDGKIEYEGSFKEGKKIIFYENGEYYDGDLVNNIREGNGKYYYCNKSL
jgi:hypothetical protein